jgi:prepilin-type N-terminal cleavage/methylation domain-containing protein/prepilin-type processing-associated H-X9-DG protein
LPCEVKASAVRQAFTLLELLVVLAIIGLLAALLLPALSRSRAAGQQGRCVSNVRQIAVAIDLYTADNEQEFPLNYDGLAGRQLVPNWAYGNMADPFERRDADVLVDPARTLLTPYLKTARLYKCPSDRTDAVRSVSLNCRVQPVRLSGAPRWLGGAGTNYPIFRRTGEMASPSQTFTVLDEDQRQINDGYFAVDLSNTGNPDGQGAAIPLAIIDFPGQRHTRAATVAFGDGHVEVVRWKDALLSARSLFPGLRVDPASHDGRWLHEHVVGKPASEP